MVLGQKHLIRDDINVFLTKMIGRFPGKDLELKSGCAFYNVNAFVSKSQNTNAINWTLVFL